MLSSWSQFFFRKLCLTLYLILSPSFFPLVSSFFTSNFVIHLASISWAASMFQLYPTNGVCIQNVIGLNKVSSPFGLCFFSIRENILYPENSLQHLCSKTWSSEERGNLHLLCASFLPTSGYCTLYTLLFNHDGSCCL